MFVNTLRINFVIVVHVTYHTNDKKITHIFGLKIKFYYSIPVLFYFK